MKEFEVAQVQTYRGLAEKCRAMAKLTRRSGPLLSRAEIFDAAAAAIEQGDEPPRDAA
jgi:hypothetical protein